MTSNIVVLSEDFAERKYIFLLQRAAATPDNGGLLCCVFTLPLAFITNSSLASISVLLMHWQSRLKHSTGKTICFMLGFSNSKENLTHIENICFCSTGLAWIKTEEILKGDMNGNAY